MATLAMSLTHFPVRRCAEGSIMLALHVSGGVGRAMWMLLAFLGAAVATAVVEGRPDTAEDEPSGVGGDPLGAQEQGGDPDGAVTGEMIDHAEDWHAEDDIRPDAAAQGDPDDDEPGDDAPGEAIIDKAPPPIEGAGEGAGPTPDAVPARNGGSLPLDEPRAPVATGDEDDPWLVGWEEDVFVSSDDAPSSPPPPLPTVPTAPNEAQATADPWLVGWEDDVFVSSDDAPSPPPPPLPTVPTAPNEAQATAEPWLVGWEDDVFVSSDAPTLPEKTV
jgi:hypothetical protein